jgi:hypothetical protein
MDPGADNRVAPAVQDASKHTAVANRCVLAPEPKAGTLRCGATARVERAEPEFSGCLRIFVAPLNAAWTAQRAVPTFKGCGYQDAPVANPNVVLSQIPRDR